MKKIVALLVIAAGLFLYSCEEIITLEPCERDNTGTFIVLNTTGYTVTVDIDDTSERTLRNGGQTTYYDIVAGSHRMYINLGDGWQYNTQHLSACETVTYTWYLTNSKSTDNLRLDVSIDGVVIETISTFKTKE
jgi:hypothetical protein